MKRILLLGLLLYCTLLATSSWKSALRPTNWDWAQQLHFFSQNFSAQLGFLSGETVFNDAQVPTLWRDQAQCLEVLEVSQNHPPINIYSQPSCSPSAIQWTADPISEVMYKIMKAIEFSLTAPAEMRSQSLLPRIDPQDGIAIISEYFCSISKRPEDSEIALIWKRKLIRLDRDETRELTVLHSSWSCKTHDILTTHWLYKPRKREVLPQ